MMDTVDSDVNRDRLNQVLHVVVNQQTKGHIFLSVRNMEVGKVMRK